MSAALIGREAISGSDFNNGIQRDFSGANSEPPPKPTEVPGTRIRGKPVYLRKDQYS